MKTLDEIICVICGNKMVENEFAYDNNQYGKVYYKCEECGHKMNIIKQDIKQEE